MQLYTHQEELNECEDLKKEFLTLLWERDHITSRLSNRVRPLPLELRTKVDEDFSKINGLLSICDDKFIKMRDSDFWETEILTVDLHFFLEKIKSYVEEIKKTSGIRVTPY